MYSAAIVENKLILSGRDDTLYMKDWLLRGLYLLLRPYNQCTILR
jgi:hypothetical protein